MTEILDKFVSIWYYWMFISFGLAIIGFIILFIRKYSKIENSNKYLKIGIILISQAFLTWIIGFGTLWTIQYQARQELKEFLSQPDLIVTINNELIDKKYSMKIINEIKTISNIEAHHSSPTELIKIKIDSGLKTINLDFKQDSENKNEYWIFWDKYKVTRTNEIGRIRTEIFKDKNGG
jgi:hypothetical protein